MSDWTVFETAPSRLCPDRMAIEPIPVQVGSWRGEAVRLAGPTHATLLEQAREERTFGFSEAIESKALTERKISEGRIAASLSAVHDIDAYFERLPYFDHTELPGLLRDIRSDDPALQDILRKVRQRFADPSYAYAALDLAARELRREGLDQLAVRTDGAKAQLMAKQGVAIRAGLNVSVAASEVAAGDQRLAAELRDLYRATVSGDPGPLRLYREILSKFGVEGFARHVAFLTRALGEDIASAGPSVEPARLWEILSGLSALRVLDTVHECCQKMVERIRRRPDTIDITATGVMRQLLPLVENTVPGPSKIIPIPERLGIPPVPLDLQIAVLRECRDLLAMIPVGVYRDLEARKTTLRAVEEAMDIRIEREESA
ncbi:type III secretion system gatekeeper subunit SctW [Mesorhizobium huakuii]|uniref:Type III secretion system gatekeeper subunit SctW n=1 Tax=Mesorhizobium huakuii TaxID=28104 RepID=A0A7G6T5W9_9HYPH|nr:type III secretion system gatekeeper subunit SctW [Mesorhizobium huakuii]QND62151.1 type III secretion system gatekeeper subunit SctW [Mesorhizobium huakuii]QND69516.1 type III secretion system gatekeeper subunit SctW [Mesorhizobium loti]